MKIFTQYHLLNFNDEVVMLRIQNFTMKVLRPLAKDKQIYLTSKEISEICGTGRTNEALRSCLTKVGGTNGRKVVDGNAVGCAWELNAGNWKKLAATISAFNAMKKKTEEITDPVVQELIDSRQPSAATQRDILEH